MITPTNPEACNGHTIMWNGHSVYIKDTPKPTQSTDVYQESLGVLKIIDERPKPKLIVSADTKPGNNQTDPNNKNHFPFPRDQRNGLGTELHVEQIVKGGKRL